MCVPVDGKVVHPNRLLLSLFCKMVHYFMEQTVRGAVGMGERFVFSSDTHGLNGNSVSLRG